MLISKSCLVCNFRVIYVKRLLTSEREISVLMQLWGATRYLPSLLKRPKDLFSNISKTSASVSSGFQTRENWWKHEAAGRVLFIVFECLKPRWNTKHEFLKFLLQQKKISLNYHFNKVSQFNYYIWDVKCAWCAWSYHLTAALWQFLNIHQLMSRCCLAVCQFWANTLLRKANGRVQI